MASDGSVTMTGRNLYRGPVSSQVSSVAFCFGLSESCCYEYPSLFLLKGAAYGGACFTEKHFLQRRSGRAFLDPSILPGIT